MCAGYLARNSGSFDTTILTNALICGYHALAVRKGTRRMQDKPCIESAATIVPVRDVAGSISFYRDVLQFDVVFCADDKSIAIVRRDGAVIQLLQTHDAGALAATANNIAIYLTIKSVDRLYADLADDLADLPAGRVRPPFNQDYGMREFHVKDPDGCLLFFGEDIQ